MTRRRFRPGGAARDAPFREREAIAAAKAGNWDGLHFLYARYVDDVYGYVQSIVRDQYEAEDITQDVFAKLMAVISRYEERSVPFAAWIMRVARNATLDHLRVRNRQIPVDEVRLDDRGQDGPTFERRECLKEALASLPDEQRRVLVLRHLAGLSPGEIAERLGKTESSVQGLHHRGRSSLKAALRESKVAPVTVSR
ncbi:MAG TPA: sigma-70 family RNA polymerase sigma factor [Solirubrobacterales bacterium]|nr:sigma-70 family RNA polymerase sigma factor [Solirubrobacterales bacterium]